MKTRIKVLPKLVLGLLLVATAVCALKVLPFTAPANAESLSATTNSAAKAESYNAKSAMLMDASTGQVLLSQNADARLPIASMVKIMTLTLIFEDIDAGKISKEDMVTVSQNASSMGGSQAFLDAAAEYKVDELIKSIVVASANDSCVAMAEHLDGSVEGFVARMNDRAAALNLSNTNFVNCTGLPADGQYSCASDAATMFRNLIAHEEFFEYAGVWMFDFAHPSGRVTGLTNTNKLVRFYNGCDAGKTGFTTEALSCLAATARRGDTRLISVVLGAPSAKERNAEVSKMFNFGFANFETRQIVFKGLEVDTKATVKNGKVDFVAAAPATDYFHLLKKGEKPEVTVSLEMDKVSAPIAAGDEVGRIVVTVDGECVAKVAVVAQENVKKANYLDTVDRMISNW